YVMLFTFDPPTDGLPSIDWTEILLIMLVSCMLLEEFRYFLNQDNLTLWGKCGTYFPHLFKQLTVLSYVLFYVGLILRFRNVQSPENFDAARIVMAYCLWFWYLRSLSFLSALRFVGPHLVAIGKMLQDLMFFMILILLVMAAYGVASRSMAYYDIMRVHGFYARHIFKDIAYPVYYLMYTNWNNETTALDTSPDASWAIATHILLAVHLLLINILLINLLIALFNKRFDQVHDDITNIWYYQRYLFIREHYDRPPFIPPVSLLFDIWYLCKMLFHRIQRARYMYSNPEIRVFS
ncbi:unnamed protein product, partial [Didymodactylos carnosus]